MRPFALVIAAGLVAAAAACASADALRAEHLRRELDGLRYDEPIDDVWREVTRLLSERQYPLAGKDAGRVGEVQGLLVRFLSPARETREDGRGGRFLETGWRGGVRYRVDGSVDGAGARVVFTAIEEDLTEHGRDAGRRRDLEMELELARRVAPPSAARIEGSLRGRSGK